MGLGEVKFCVRGYLCINYYLLKPGEIKVAGSQPSLVWGQGGTVVSHGEWYQQLLC